MILPDDILPGDLIISRSSWCRGPKRFYDPGIRLYTDPHCDTWDARLDERTVGLAVSVHQNKHGQDVCNVILPQGVRWIYEQDVICLKTIDM